MAKVRSRDTSWERKFRSEAWRRGMRYRIHYGDYKIDIAFPSLKVAVFLDSCFWHFCPRHREIPKANRGLWLKKFRRNRLRDREATLNLKRAGWMVVRIWSHEFNRDLAGSVDKVERAIQTRTRRRKT